MITRKIDWPPILHNACALVEKRQDITLCIDTDILNEIALKVEETLHALQMNTMPNVAKVAGHVAFWIRKLKPIYHAPASTGKLLTINEVVGILVGVGICQQYFDDHSRAALRLPARVMKDWAASLRNHSHSPHSCAIAFEFLASDH